MLDARLSGRDGVKHGEQGLNWNIGQEPERTEIYPNERDINCRRNSSSREQGSIAPQYDNEVKTTRRHLRARDDSLSGSVVCSFRINDDFVMVRRQPFAQPRKNLRDLRTARSRDDRSRFLGGWWRSRHQV